MTDYVRLAVMPDELASSYRDRLIRVNGWGPSVLSTEKLSLLTGGMLNGGIELSNVEVLAGISGMSIYEFIQSHTMLPLRKAVTSPSERRDVNYVERNSLLVKKAHCATRSHLYFCPDCVNEDINQIGAPYWRRRHQIPGMYWCPQHQSALHFTAHPGVKVMLPSDVLHSSTEVPAQSYRDAKSNAFVCRYIEICNAMLEFKAPIRDAKLHRLFKQRIPQLRASGRSDFPPIQRGLLHSIYDADWLRDVFNRTCKNPALASGYIERALERYSPGVISIGYALLLAAMFEFSCEAIQAISEHPDLNVDVTKGIQQEASFGRQAMYIPA